MAGLSVHGGRAQSPRRVGGFVLGVAAVAVVAAALLGWAGPPGTHSATASAGAGWDPARMVATAGPAAPLGMAARDATSGSTLALGVQVAPQAICLSSSTLCAAGTNTARVTLTADVGGAATISWPAVEVAFVVETTIYDGVYDPINGNERGADPCLAVDSLVDPCESSNGVPFFAVNAQAIANAISAANPRTQVSFALVDYFATGDDWNDGDGVEYHVDVPTFVPSGSFGAAVHSSFDTEVLNGYLDYEDADLYDNFLHSSSITALYGAIVGSGLDWSADTHHVIVWMGSTAPRDPGYVENYCVSAHAGTPVPFGPCDGGVCEPSYEFSTGASPNCEGWVESQDGNSADSIAALAHTAPACTESIGGVCTIDAIDYWDTATDPYSEGWPDGAGWTSIGGGPGGSVVLEDTANVLNAGCAIAAATGGTWDGPAFWSCPHGPSGTLQYVGPGPYNEPNTQNPTLFAALKGIGFGPLQSSPVASGTDQPLFTYVPFGSIALAPTLQATAACERGGELLAHCQTVPTVLHADGISYLGWNWSTNRSANTLLVGDEWTASFDVVATGPPYQIVPVDACVGVTCAAGGSGAVDSLYTWASYVPGLGQAAVLESFPLGTVRVESSPATPLAAAPPAAPPAPPAIPTATPPPLPVVQQLGASSLLSFGQVSFQATAAGFLGAGFLRVSLKHRPLALRVAAQNGPAVSRFDADTVRRQLDTLRFE